MAGIRIEGNTSGNVAEVNAAGELKVTLSQSEDTAGYATMTSEVDGGTVTTTRLMRDLETSEDYRLRVGVDTLLFSEFFPGAAYNSAVWTQVLTTMTATVANGFATLNAGLSVASAAVARVQTYRSFPIFNTVPTYMECVLQFAQPPVTSNVTEWGMFIASGTTAPTDGAFFRFLANGEFRAVVNANGTETQSGTLNSTTLVGTNTSHHFVIAVADDDCEFWIDDVLVAKITRPAAGYAMVASQNLPMCFRTYNSGATGSAQVMRVGMVGCSIGDIGSNKPWAHILTGAGGHSSQGQTGGTMLGTALWANSANPAAAVPTNTTAALGTGLGGNFWSTASLAVNTDGIISSYQVPLGTAALPGKSLYITGVVVDSIVQTVLAGGPFILQWGIAYGHNTVTIATAADTVVLKAPRRIPLGFQYFPATAAVGSQGGRLTMQFMSPILVQPGEFIATIYKNIGTVGTSGTIAHVIGFEGYWE